MVPIQFTLVFPPIEGAVLSVAAVFTPCLVWKEGDQTLLTPHPDNPHYLPGDLQELFRKLPLRKRLDPEIRRMHLITHSAGHGPRPTATSSSPISKTWASNPRSWKRVEGCGLRVEG